MQKAWLALFSVGFIFLQDNLEFNIINNDLLALMSMILIIWTSIDISNSVDSPMQAGENERRYNSGRYRI